MVRGECDWRWRVVGIVRHLEHTKTIVPALFLTPASPSIMWEPPMRNKVIPPGRLCQAVLARSTQTRSREFSRVVLLRGCISRRRSVLETCEVFPRYTTSDD